MGVGCILYALYDGKQERGGGGFKSFSDLQDHSYAFVFGVLLIVFSFA